jgi:hypothetical protein
MKPTLGWQFRQDTDILARFKEMGWVPPTERRIESTTGGNTGRREPGGAGQGSGYHQVEHKPLEAAGGGSGDPCPSNRETVWDLGSQAG